VLTALDNTWGAGLAFNPFDLVPSQPGGGVDISRAQALTKYPSGGGDVLMGSVITRDAALHLQIKLTHMRLGLGVGINDVERCCAALPSIYLRYQAHDQAARTLAAWCQHAPRWRRCCTPPCRAAPGHDHWKALHAGRAGRRRCRSVQHHGATRGTPSCQVDAFCDRLKLFRLGYSWGGPISLVVPYELQSMRRAWPAHLARGTLVRFSTGLEDVEDLQADLAGALAVLAQTQA
jgi:cystathionine beta-lyase